MLLRLMYQVRVFISHIRLILLCLAAFGSLGCGSLVGEIDDVKAAYALEHPVTVTATDPADNTIAPTTQTYIDVTFSSPIDTSTFTAQSDWGPCSGSFQVSYDGFQNCLGGTVDASANPRIRFTPQIFPKGLGLQIRVTSAVMAEAEYGVVAYTSPVGFKLAAACGAQNCFFSYSTPLMYTGGTTGIFGIATGANAGKLIVMSNGTGTTLVDPANATAVDGPTLCGTPASGAFNFYISSGIAAGKQFVALGGTGICMFDPSTSTFTGGSGPIAFGSNTYAFQPTKGSDAGNTLIVSGGTGNIYRFTASSGTLSSTPAYTFAGTTGSGAHSIYIASGAHAGQDFLFQGANTGTINLFDETSAALAGPATTIAALNSGAASFQITSGTNAGKLLTLAGTTSAASTLYDLATDTAAAGPSLSATLGVGALLLWKSSGSAADNPLVLTGQLNTKSERYDATSGSFVSGPQTTGTIGDNASAFYIKASQATSDAFFIVNGNLAGTSTSVYFPSSNAFHGSRMPSTVPNSGSTHFSIVSGTHKGRTMILGGNNSKDTAIFDPIRLTMLPGPQTQLTGTTGSFNIDITQGSNAGQVAVFAGNGSAAYDVYDPASNSFSSGALAFTAMSTGALAFPIVNDSRIVVMHGGGATTTQVFDQLSNSLVTPISPAPLCGPNGASISLRFKRPSTGEERQLIHCASGQMLVFDHTTKVFATSSLTLPATPGGGAHAFVIPSGPNAGKILVIYGGLTNSTALLDTEVAAAPYIAISASPAPSTCAFVNSGAQVFKLTTGINANKVLLVTGNNSQTTCLFDSATTSFSTGPNVGATTSAGFNVTAGSVAFKANGGLYPNAFILLSGATKNVWNVYVP